jgi:hypothetical protein
VPRLVVCSGVLLDRKRETAQRQRHSCGWRRGPGFGSAAGRTDYSGISAWCHICGDRHRAVSRDGLLVLDKIESQQYDVLVTGRPKISKREKMWLLLSSLTRVAFSRAA